LASREGVLDTPAHEKLVAEKPGYQEFNDRKFLATSPALYASMIRDMFSRGDSLDVLRKLDVPALVIAGEQDEPFLGPSTRMADALPQGRFVVVPEAGHSPQFENPDGWWDAIEAFLGGIPTT
jgi:pimeloyl-ACP methyl ester carboxylesterase